MDSTRANRSPIVAGLLSLGFPGLGHAYVGRLGRGLILLGAAYAAVLLGAWGGIWPTFAGACLLVAVLLGVWLGVAADAASLARRSKPWRPKGYNRILGYVVVALLLVAVPRLVFGHSAKLLGYKTYRVASASMEPTLREGDRILVDTWHYRQSLPHPGEVIIHQGLRDPAIAYVKRVIAVGGQTIAIRDGVVLVDGRRLDEAYLPEDTGRCPLSQTLEPTLVPEGSVFVLGDSRDVSQDSRFWGPVPADLIRGQVTYVLLSMDGTRIGQRIALGNT